MGVTWVKNEKKGNQERAESQKPRGKRIESQKKVGHSISCCREVRKQQDWESSLGLAIKSSLEALERASSAGSFIAEGLEEWEEARMHSFLQGFSHKEEEEEEEEMNDDRCRGWPNCASL